MKINRPKKRCTKIQYRSREEARAALKMLRDTGARRFYRCPYCQGNVWHLTSQQEARDRIER